MNAKRKDSSYNVVDLVDNNSKMVLGLLWRVIAHYHIQVWQSLSDVREKEC
jgi:hypothetical protein